MSSNRTTFKEELINLAEAVCEQKGWGERYLSERFGQSNAMRILRDGKHGLGLNTAERFRSWLEDQLSPSEPTPSPGTDGKSAEPPGCGDGLYPGGSACRAEGAAHGN
jgi:hypothetical protein